MHLASAQWLTTQAAQPALQWAFGCSLPIEQLAVQARKQVPPEHAPALTQAADCHRRMRHKLPTWAAAGCLATRQAVEQATPEALLPLLHNGWRGNSALDLTHGLGADAEQLAQCVHH
jgi:hypothetical protein